MGEVIQLADRTRAIKSLREQTKLGLDACKKALEKTGWNVEKAEAMLLAESGQKASKSKDRDANEGCVVVANHNARIGAMVEVRCETDFAAKTPEFKAFCENLLDHIIGVAPRYLSEDDIPDDEMAEKATDIRADSEEEFSDEFEAWFDEVCLMRQHHINPFLASKTIEQLREELAAKLGENVVVKRYVRWELAEDVVPEYPTRAC